MLLAATLQGAIFALVKAAVDRAAAAGTHKLTGTLARRRIPVADGTVARGPATAPQPAFETREVGGAIQICPPGAG